MTLGNFLKKEGKIISGLATGLTIITGVASSALTTDGLVKQACTVITVGSFFVAVGMLVMYAIEFLSVGINNGNINERMDTIDNNISNLFKEFSQMQKDMKDKYDKISADTKLIMNDKSIGTCPIISSTYVEDSEDVNTLLHTFLKKHGKDIKELDIICFGRKGFGGNVEYIINKKMEIKIRIILFNVASHPDICLDNDKITIDENIIKWNKKQSMVEVLVSDIPPMVRAAVAYGENNGERVAVWGTMQSYRFKYDEILSKISLEKPSHSLISVVDQKSTSANDFYALVNCFEEEFKRLESASKVAVISRKGGKVEVELQNRTNP